MQGWPGDVTSLPDGQASADPEGAAQRVLLAGCEKRAASGLGRAGLEPRRFTNSAQAGPLGPEASSLQGLKPGFGGRRCGGAEAPPLEFLPLALTAFASLALRKPPL